MVMLILQLASWWFGEGWRQVAKRGWQRLVGVSHLFSLPILIRTLWAPWRRIVTYPGASIDAKLRAMGDNMVSRCIGFTVRTLVLIAAGLILGLTAAGSALSVIIWPLIPVAVPVLVIKAIIG
jgi:hypothetical protein